MVKVFGKQRGWQLTSMSNPNYAEDTLVYTNPSGHTAMTMRPDGNVYMPGPLTVGGLDVVDELKRIDYILQRIAPNYDELNKQFAAVEDLRKASNECR